ncbi:MAG: DnaJ domain-containing protein [Spirochaetaceae bacterium]
MGRSRTHYEALGVPKTAGRDEIRRAFRTKAKELHPDAGGSADARLFHEAQNAYEVLRDPAKRREYDRLLASTSYASTAGGAFTDSDRILWELWEAFFGPESHASPGEYRHRTTEKRDAIRYTVTVTPEEARSGTRVQLPHDSRRKVYADIPPGSAEGTTVETEITDLFGSRTIVVTVRVRESVHQKT